MTSRHRFFRKPFRPSDANDAVAVEFDQQLDAWAMGTPAPKPGVTSTATDQARLEDLTSAFRQATAMAMDAATQDASRPSTEHAKKIIWEDIMSATTPRISTNTATPVLNPIGSRWADSKRNSRPLGRDGNQDRSRSWFPHLSPVLNAAMVAIMLLTLGLGAFAVTGGSDRWGLGGNGNDSGDPHGLASLPAGSQGTPVAANDLPTADECTVMPLTVDQVMDRIKGETSSTASSSPTTFSATPGPTGSPSDEMLQQISTAHREFIACVLKGDQLQVWALIHPNSGYWGEFLSSYSPFTDEATVRTDLEALASGSLNPASRLPNVTNMLSLDMALPLVNPDPNATLLKYNFMTDAGPDRLAFVGMIYRYPYDEARSSPDSAPRAIPRADMAVTWAYSWNRDTDSWMVSTIGIDSYRG
ncbi:MAG: hypothetical protein ACR2OU_00980 [Thermomicrobiales bacterium]